MRVNNLGLLNDQRNYSMLGGVIAVIGVLLIFKGDNDKSQINNSSPTTVNPTNLYLSEFTGDKSLANDAYKIYLSKKYTIEKDAALDKFVCNDRLFNNVDDALTYANSLEQSLTDSFKSTTSNKVSEASSQVSENHNSSQSILSDQANKAESSQEKNSDNKLISDNKLMIIISAVLIFGLGTFFFYKSNTSSNSAQSNTSPLSPTEMATRVDSLADQGKTEEAIELGRTFLKTNKDPQGAVEKSLKRAYIAAAQTPSPDSASSDKASSPDWMKKESTSSLSPNLTPSKTEPQSTESVSVDGASVITGPNGTVVRAGDAVVIMPK